MLSSCQPQSDQSHQSKSIPSAPEADLQQTPGTDTVRFEAAFAQFLVALQARDTAAVNTFIDPQAGFWLIEQPGAVPAYTHYASVEQVKRHYQQLPFWSVAAQLDSCRLQQRDSFPAFDCALMDNGGSGYAEDGCFYTNGSAFQGNDMWKYASLGPQQEAQVQALQQRVQRSVLHTRSSFRFHFGYDGNRWRLLFADLRVPCSA